MSLLHFRCKERRRTVRVSLVVPLTVLGLTESGEKFCIQTHSQSVNRDGALFPSEHSLIVGQELKLVNEHTAKSVDCRVATIRRARDGKTYVGVEFSANFNFWHMAFPIPGARPLRRPFSSSKASA